MEKYGRLRKAIPKENSMKKFVQEFNDKNSNEEFCRVQDILPPNTTTTSSLFPSMSKLSLKRPLPKLAPIFNKENFPRNKRKSSTGGGSSQLGIEYLPIPKKKPILERSQSTESSQSLKQFTSVKRRPEQGWVTITGNVQFVLKTFKLYPELKALYEVYANVLKINKTKIRFERIILMRDESGPILQGIYYDFDNILMEFNGVTIMRCVGNFNSQHRFHIHKVEEIESLPDESELNRIQNVSAFALLQAQNEKKT